MEKPGFEDYIFDYFRYRTFELAAREIKNRKVKGNVAEVGVFKGQFSRLINEIFPEKTLYLLNSTTLELQLLEMVIAVSCVCV